VLAEANEAADYLCLVSAIFELGYDNVFQCGPNDTIVPLGLADYLYKVKGFETKRLHAIGKCGNVE